MKDFPIHGLLPKQETQASSFLSQNPFFDGKNVTIAILDTGIDPGAPGLLTCPDGSHKLTHIIDCTGTGEVRYHSIQEAKKEERNGQWVTVVQGASGKTLMISDQWENPTGKYKVGIKSETDLFPKALLERLKKVCFFLIFVLVE